jgi:PII interaction protein X
MSLEAYLNHPTFGLLLMVCTLEDRRELFTTLYAQRLFFLVRHLETGLTFDPVTRGDARSLVESRIRHLRRQGDRDSLARLQEVYQRTFHFH